MVFKTLMVDVEVKFWLFDYGKCGNIVFSEIEIASKDHWE